MDLHMQIKEKREPTQLLLGKGGGVTWDSLLSFTSEQLSQNLMTTENSGFYDETS